MLQEKNPPGSAVQELGPIRLIRSFFHWGFYTASVPGLICARENREGGIETLGKNDTKAKQPDELRRQMKVLHLYSDWRWTGPAEPTVNLCKALLDLGVNVVLACTRPVKTYPVSLAGEALSRGLSVTTRFHLDRYLNPIKTASDLCTLPGFLKAERVDLVHCHLSHDHFLGGIASKICGIPLIRTNHKARPLNRTIGNSLLLEKLTDGMVEFSKGALSSNRERFKMGGERMLLVDGAIDLERFNPDLPSQDLRPILGLGSGEVLVGIVARVQRHRRWDLLLKAMKILDKTAPQVKLMVLGRGTHINELLIEPVKHMGLAHRVIMPGYRRDDYVEYLKAIDMKVFLVPGSDGTCRAVREAMALGKPVISTKRGMLPELIEHGRTGLLVEEDPIDLAEAIRHLAVNEGERLRMGIEARKKAHRDFSISAQARKVLIFYERILALGKKGLSGGPTAWPIQWTRNKASRGPKRILE